MDVQQFEQAILKLAFETDARITTASVAYYLGIPSRKANELLNELLEEGVLELDSDQDGNLYYRVPHKPEQNAGLMPRLLEEKRTEVDARLDAAGEPAQAGGSKPGRKQTLSPSVMLVSADDDGEAEPLSPRASGQSGPRPSTPATTHFDSDDDLDGQPGRHQPAARQAPTPRRQAEADRGRPAADGWSPSRQPRVRTRQPDGDLFAGLTQRQARPDASLDQCGASSMVVSNSVRCDPKPLPERKPVLASCVDSSARARQWKVDEQRQDSAPLFDRAQSQSTMLAPTAGGELALREDHLERPEHQPGMALLLSLILCGTGQIYNGEVSKGIMMMVLCFLLWFVLLGWVVHIWSIVDSVVVAERLNRKTG